MTQDAPFCVQIEATEGCNLRCTFCGLNGIRGGVAETGLNLKFMSVATATAIASQIASAGWNPRFEFAMHGEPTLNPRLPDIVRVFRQHLPKSYMLLESNGGGLSGGLAAHRIQALFEAGLSTVALDEYQGVELVGRIRQTVEEDGGMVFTSPNFSIHEYPEDPKGNPHQRRPGRRLVFIAPIDAATKGTHSKLNNHCGCGAPKNDRAAGRRCAKPFREISVRWDGSIALCCNDWRGTYKCGNVHGTPIDVIWQNEFFDAARKKLYAGQRDFGPCAGCDAISYRTGLLPDHKGLDVCYPAGDEDLQAIEEACSGDPYTQPVMREWELVQIK